MFRTVSIEMSRAAVMPRKSPFTSVTWPLFMATSVPVPIATPTSALASAGASLMPSPAMATMCPSFWSLSTSASLSAGLTSPCTSSMPSLAPTALAVVRPSPVAITMRRPLVCKVLMASSVVNPCLHLHVKPSEAVAEHRQNGHGDRERQCLPEAPLEVQQFVVVFLVQRNDGLQRHAALGTSAGVVLTHLGVHGAGVDRAARLWRRGDGCVRRYRHCRVHGMAAMVMRVPMGHLALGHQMHLALGAAARAILTHLGMHGAGVNNGCTRLHGGWLQIRPDGESFSLADKLGRVQSVGLAQRSSDFWYCALV